MQQSYFRQIWHPALPYIQKPKRARVRREPLPWKLLISWKITPDHGCKSSIDTIDGPFSNTELRQEILLRGLQHHISARNADVAAKVPILIVPLLLKLDPRHHPSGRHVDMDETASSLGCLSSIDAGARRFWIIHTVRFEPSISLIILLPVCHWKASGSPYLRVSEKWAAPRPLVSLNCLFFRRKPPYHLIHSCLYPIDCECPLVSHSLISQHVALQHMPLYHIPLGPMIFIVYDSHIYIYINIPSSHYVQVYPIMSSYFWLCLHYICILHGVRGVPINFHSLNPFIEINCRRNSQTWIVQHVGIPAAIFRHHSSDVTTWGHDQVYPYVSSKSTKNWFYTHELPLMIS